MKPLPLSLSATLRATRPRQARRPRGVAVRIHPQDCGCARCAPPVGLSRRACAALLLLGFVIGALCDAGGVPDPFTLIF